MSIEASSIRSRDSRYPFSGAVELKYSWEELKSMIDEGNIAPDIQIGDYKTITLSDGQVMIMEVAGIDTYYRSGWWEGQDEAVFMGHHIDFISREIV